MCTHFKSDSLIRSAFWIFYSLLRDNPYSFLYFGTLWRLSLLEKKTQYQTEQKPREQVNTNKQNWSASASLSSSSLFSNRVTFIRRETKWNLSSLWCTLRVLFIFQPFLKLDALTNLTFKVYRIIILKFVYGKFL